jgi:GT2 family glycosyltransferase
MMNSSDSDEGMADQPDVDVVLVAYNSEPVICEALRSVDSPANIIVVDNGSSDQTVAHVTASGSAVIRADQNLGFGKACNLGARHGRAPYVLFLNPDARLAPGSVKALIAAMRKYKHWAAANPRILRADARQQFRRTSRLHRGNRLRKILRLPPPTETCEVAVLSGSAMICRRTDFEAVGGFDENLFLYFEDDDLSIRFLRTGRKIGYVHEALVTHIGNASTISTPDLEKLKAYYFMKSLQYAAKKHGVPFSKLGRLCRYGIGYGRAIITRNQKNATRLAGYLRALQRQVR